MIEFNHRWSPRVRWTIAIVLAPFLAITVALLVIIGITVIMVVGVNLITWLSSFSGWVIVKAIFGTIGLFVILTICASLIAEWLP